MKCKNCGVELPEGSTVCFECGASQHTVMEDTQELAQAPAQNAEKATEKAKIKCKNCGAELTVGATVCFECGAPQNTVNTTTASGGTQISGAGTAKSKILAAVLAFFLGCYGIDQFYLGFVKKGIARIIVTFVTAGFGGVIWGVVDCVRIATGAIRADALGNPIV